MIEWFRATTPVAETELHEHDPVQLLVAVILSVWCTDKQVNWIILSHFKRFPPTGKMAAVEPEEVFEEIRSCSYPNNKAKNLVGMARKLISNFRATASCWISFLNDSKPWFYR